MVDDHILQAVIEMKRFRRTSYCCFDGLQLPDPRLDTKSLDILWLALLTFDQNVEYCDVTDRPLVAGQDLISRLDFPERR